MIGMTFTPRCYICNKGTMKKKKVEYKIYGVLLGKFDAEVCDQCSEIFFDEVTSRKITEIAKQKGLFGLEAKTKIGKNRQTFRRLSRREIPPACPSEIYFQPSDISASFNCEEGAIQRNRLDESPGIVA